MSIRPCLHPGLLGDVSALNRRFIAVFTEAASAGRFAAEPGLVQRLGARLGAPDSSWPECPFLLYRVVRAGERPADAVLDPFEPGVASLLTVTLGFLWQLARELPPAARAVSGAEADWCDALASMSIAQLSLVSARLSLRPRLVDVPGFWQDLARKSGISALQRASLGAAGMQLIQARARRARVSSEWLPRPRDALAAPAGTRARRRSG